MYYTIILFEFIVVSKIIFGIEQHCRTYDEIKNKAGTYRCYDGGCVFFQKRKSPSCICSFSEGVMTGNHCGNYVDMCHPNPCGENGKCFSGIGHHICECFDNFHGINCTLTTDNPLEIIKRPSIYYRIKSKQNEYLKLLIVSNTFGKNDYTVNIKTKSQQFRKKLKDIKTTTQVSDLVQLCQNTLNSDLFTLTKCKMKDVEKNECDDICLRLLELYVLYDEVETAIVPYFITKIISESYENDKVYFEPVDKVNRMGIKHNLDVQIYVNKDQIEYQYYVRQFVIDDKLSVCLPLFSILYKENTKKMYKNELNAVIASIDETDKQQICSKNEVNINYKLKIFSQNFFHMSFKDYEILDGLSNSNIGEIQESNGIISVRPYKLRAGKYILYFQHIIYDSVKKLTEKNTYFRDIEIILVGLKAIIKGSTAPMSVINNQLLTLDATGSINPNEDELYKQTLLEFTWECNIVNDNNCKQYNTKEPKRTLEKYLLYKDTAYNFTLTVDVMDHYKTDVGTPSKGYDCIIVYDGLIQNVIEHSIKCIRNCNVFSNPAHEICFKAENNLNNPTFTWSYRQYGDNNNTPVDKIKQKDVSTQLLVVKKYELNYGITYTFFVDYPELNLTSNITITAVTKPSIEECKINPDSGIAGKTLFTISCMRIKSNRKTIFEYYQANKNDKTNTVLLHWSHGPLFNFKLTSSNSLVVKVINDYGAFDQFPINATIEECNTSLLNSLFKQIKVKLKMKDTSNSVVLISIVSDILHDNSINEFNTLFEALDQIPILENCIICADQFILILHKVIGDYNIFTNGNMEFTELLIISKQLYRVSISLFKYIKTASDDDKWKESDKIERIKKKLQNNINRVKNIIVFPKEDQDNTTNYYMKSTFENLNGITQNLDLVLKVFGMIQGLDILTYERPITCENKQFNFKSCVLLPEWLIERTFPTESTQMIYDTIGKSLANELLSKGDKWAITIFNNEDNRTQTLNISDGTQTNLPIVSLDIVNVDESHINNFLTHTKLDNYFDLNFTSTLKENYKMYTINVPGIDSTDVQFDKSIIVYRIDMKIIGNVFVTLNKATYNLRFAWLRATRPNIELMTNGYIHTIQLYAGRSYKFELKSLNKHKNQIHYIGVYVNMDENILTRNDTFNVNFSISIIGIQCLYWTGSKWTSDDITVGPTTTANNLQCQSKHTSLFSGSLLTLTDVINPYEEIPHNEELSTNIVCVTLVIIIFLIYILLFTWSKYNDNKNIPKGKIIILRDNYPREDEVYLVIIYTGYSAEAGTTANVCIQLHGNINTSRVHFLHSSEFQILQRFNDDWFIVYTPQPLGDLQYIHIWHDSYGDHPSWYCKRLDVICLRDNKKWNFIVERWFSILPNAENAEHTIFIGKPRDWKIDAKEEMELTLRDEYLWASVFISHPRSLVTRCQRLSKVLCTLFCMMLMSLFFYEIEEKEEEDFLKFEITYTQISISIQSGILEALATSIIFYCFEKSTYFIKYEIDEAEDEEVKLQYDEIKKVWWKKWLLSFCDKSPYKPAQTEKNVQSNSGYNYWLIAGWTLCIAIYCLSAFYIMLSGLKIGQVKSMHWLMTLVISILRTVFLSEPIKIIISSCILYKLLHGHTVIYTYNVVLSRFRGSTIFMLQNLETIQKLRESRKRLRYYPLTKEDAKIEQHNEKERIRYSSFKEIGITCVFVIFTSLCCIYIIYSLDNPTHVIHGNNINRLFLSSLLYKKTMDLDTLKSFLKEPLTNHLNVREFYNGIPIMAFPVRYKHSKNTKRGWNNLYSSKIINGGVRLRQNRIRLGHIGWTMDHENYNPGWVKTNKHENVSAWVYSSLPVTKYFDLWFPYTDNSGYILDLIGEKSEYKINLAKHLDNGWLDINTRSLSIEFKTYAPNTDCVTVFKIKLQTTSGLLYTVNSVVWTVPAESVFISVNMYLLTFLIICMYTATVMRLVSSLSNMVYDYNDRDGSTWLAYFWTAYECALLTIVMLTLFTVADRWKLMERADREYHKHTEKAYVPILADMCRVHDHVVALTSVSVALVLFRAYRAIKYVDRMYRVKRTVRESGAAIAVLVFHAMMFTTWPWYGRGDHDPAVGILLLAAIVSVLSKNYVLSNVHVWPSSVFIRQSSIMSASSLMSSSSVS